MINKTHIMWRYWLEIKTKAQSHILAIRIWDYIFCRRCKTKRCSIARPASQTCCNQFAALQIEGLRAVIYVGKPRILLKIRKTVIRQTQLASGWVKPAYFVLPQTPCWSIFARVSTPAVIIVPLVAIASLRTSPHCSAAGASAPRSWAFTPKVIATITSLLQSTLGRDIDQHGERRRHS